MVLLPNNFIALIISELRCLCLISCTTFPDSTSQSSFTEVILKYDDGLTVCFFFYKRYKQYSTTTTKTSNTFKTQMIPTVYFCLYCRPQVTH